MGESMSEAFATRPAKRAAAARAEKPKAAHHVKAERPSILAPTHAEAREVPRAAAEAATSLGQHQTHRAEQAELDAVRREIETLAARLDETIADLRQEVTRLEVAGTFVQVDDLQRDFAYLTAQQAVLQRLDIQSDLVVVVQDRFGISHSAIDFGFREIEPSLNDMTSSAEARVGRMSELIAQGHFRSRWIDDCGLKIEEVNWDVSRSSFLRGLARELWTRIRAILSGPPERPAGPPAPVPVTVETTPDRRIAFCKGYFISHHGFFGLSTPAQRNLAPGWYMFGIYDRTGPRFPTDGLLYEVPTHTRIDLPDLLERTAGDE
jgi:hypothetical protein